jgi:hypothetical protein
LLVAEQIGETDRPVLTLEAIVLDHFAAGRQRAAQLRHLLDVSSQFDLLGQQRFARSTICFTLVRKTNFAPPRQLACGRERFTDCHDLPPRLQVIESIRADPFEVRSSVRHLKLVVGPHRWGRPQTPASLSRT